MYKSQRKPSQSKLNPTYAKSHKTILHSVNSNHLGHPKKTKFHQSTAKNTRSSRIRAAKDSRYRKKQEKTLMGFFGIKKLHMVDFVQEIYKSNQEVHQNLSQEFFNTIAILIDKSYPQYLQSLESMEGLASTGTMWPLTVQYFKTVLSSMFEMGEYQRIVSFAKRFRRRCRTKGDHKSLMYSQEILARVHIKQKQPKKALGYYLKVLKIALRLRNYAKELHAYDKIGMMYFLLNDVSKAEYFHQRMIQARIEDAKSNLRSLPLRKINPNKLVKLLDSDKHGSKLINSDSESEEEDPDLFYAPTENNPVKEVLKAGYDNAYLHSGNKKFKNNVAIGSVNIYADNDMTKRMYIAHYYKRIVNLQKSALTHLSTNRVIENHDSNCCIAKDNKIKDFRFTKYYSKITPGNHQRIYSAMMTYKKKIDLAGRYLEDLKEFFNQEDEKLSVNDIVSRSGTLPRLRSKANSTIKNTSIRSKSNFRRAQPGRRLGGIGMRGIYDSVEMAKKRNKQPKKSYY